MDAMDVLLRGIGAFYVFAGVVGAMATLRGRLLDRMIAAIGEHAELDGAARAARAAEERATSARAGWLLTGSWVVLAAGALLLLLADWAPWAFLASALLQATYIYYIAPVHLDPADPPDAGGRRSTTNAFVLFAAATVLAMWAAGQGRLLPVSQISPYALAAAAVAFTGFVVYTVLSFGKPLQR
jgi:hypothetical protein